MGCDCERVKCNCVKRCECQLPSSAQNHVASSFLEIVGEKPGATAPLFVDIDTNECFLETGESVGQDQHHMLDCECVRSSATASSTASARCLLQQQLRPPKHYRLERERLMSLQHRIFSKKRREWRRR